MRTLSTILIAISLGTLALGASAQTIYKHVDKDGKVYYSDKPPEKDQGGKKVDVDSNRNVLPPLVSKSSEQGGGSDKARIDRRIQKQDNLLAELEAARQQLAAAKEALAAGMEPLEDEWQTVVGQSAGGGRGKPGLTATKRIPNEMYHERIKDLENSVKNAEDNLARAETAYRRGVSN